MDRFRQMDTFLRVTRSGSFTAVAAQLSQSPAAIARHVNALEAHLGVRLLNRSTRSISLTDAGRTYAELCERVVEDISRCEAALSATEKEASGTLKMIMPKHFGSMQLGDAITEFGALHPNIQISVLLEDFSSRPHDFVERGYDLALRWGVDLRDSTLVATHLITMKRKICASPDYVARHGRPETPAELQEHNCLVHLHASADRVWRFVDDGDEMGIKVNSDFMSDSAAMLRKAAISGRGIAILPLYSVDEDLESGALVEVLPDYITQGNQLFLLYREKRLLPSRVRLFIDFLREWLERSPFGQ